MQVAKFQNVDEVLLFAIEDGAIVGSEEYFEQGGRRRDEYDLTVVQLPLQIAVAGLNVNADSESQAEEDGNHKLMVESRGMVPMMSNKISV